MDPVTHAAGCLINISNGQIAQTNVNVDRALEVGREQLKQSEASWPDEFYNTLFDTPLLKGRNVYLLVRVQS